MEQILAEFNKLLEVALIRDLLAENKGLVKSSSYFFTENKSNKRLGRLFDYHNNEKSTIKLNGHHFQGSKTSTVLEKVESPRKP